MATPPTTTEVSVVEAKHIKTFHKSADGYMIAMYTLKKALNAPSQVVNQGVFTAKGIRLPEGYYWSVLFHGHWVKNSKSKCGYDMLVDTSTVRAPKEKQGILKCLSSSMFPGIGAANAEKIYDRFGAQSIQIVSNEPDRLKEIPGIGELTVMQIIKGLKERSIQDDLLLELSPFGVQINRVKAIAKRLGEHALRLIRDNPFRLCEIPGLTFELVDSYAGHLQIPHDDPNRLTAGIQHALLQNNRQGNTCCHKQLLYQMARRILNDCGKSKQPRPAVTERCIRQHCAKMILGQLLVEDYDVDDNEVYMLPLDRQYEQGIAKDLFRLASAPIDLRSYPTRIDELISQAEKEFNITLSPLQKNGINAAFRNYVSILTGGPGTGKTLVERFILYIYQKTVAEGYPTEEHPAMLLAPTGKAASRMHHTTGDPNAKTVHKAIGVNHFGDLTAESHIPANVGLIILDEASMADAKITYQMLSLAPAGCRVVFIGDVDQLPSVSAGNVLSDMIESGVIPVTRLNEIYRRGQGSKITLNAYKVNRGETELETDLSFAVLRRDSEDEIISKTVDLYFRAVKKFSMEEVQVLSPSRDKFASSAKGLNEAIQNRRFGHTSTPCVEIGKPNTASYRKFYVGDRIINVNTNDYANNGDMGTIEDIIGEDQEEKRIVISFDDTNREVELLVSDLADIQLGYVLTVHKVQGSEFSVVILVMMDKFGHNLLRRRLLYTAFTRAKINMTTVCQWSAVETAIRNKDKNPRHTMLFVYLRTAFLGADL